MALSIKTAVGQLKYVFVKDEGRNQAMPGEEARMQYVASIIFKKDSPEHKELLAQINTEWESYKKANGVKGLPKTNGIKEEMIKDPSGEIDSATEEVRKIPSGNIIATFKTNVKWANGKPKEIKIKDKNGQDITENYQEVDWAIGEGSTGRIFGTASGNGIGGTHKVTLYLTAIQIGKLVKYLGNDVEADEIEGDEIEDLTPEL